MKPTAVLDVLATLLVFGAIQASAIGQYGAWNQYQYSKYCNATATPDSIAYTWNSTCTTTTCAQIGANTSFTQDCYPALGVGQLGSYVLVESVFSRTGVRCEGEPATILAYKLNTCVTKDGTTSQKVTGDATVLTYNTYSTKFCNGTATPTITASGHCSNGVRLTLYVDTVLTSAADSAMRSAQVMVTMVGVLLAAVFAVTL